MTTTTLDGSSTPVIIAAGTTDTLNDGDTLVLLGTIDNQGTIFADETGTESTANFVSIVLASPVVTLEGGGTVLLAEAAIYGSTATPETLVNVDNTITGSGGIGEYSPFTIEPGDTAYPINFTNEAGGVIDSTGTLAPVDMMPSGGIFIGSGMFVNDGLVEATGIDGLGIASATIDQSGGGTILASGAGVVVGFEAFPVDIVGGTLAVSGGGTIEGLADATLDGSVSPLTIGAGIDFVRVGEDTPQIQDLLGTIDNLGTIDMTGTEAAIGIGNIFLASPTVTLTGTGEVLDPTLTGAGGSPVTLVNVSNTISGFGQIGIGTIDDSAFGTIGSSAPVAVTNEAAGVIDATGTAANTGGGGDVIGDAIYLVGGAAEMVNDGLMEATGIGGLDIASTTLDQSGGGTLLASGAGVAVYLQNVDLIGGAVESSGGAAIVFNGGTNTLDSGSGPLVIAAGGTLEVTTFVSTGTLTIDAATIDNAGTLLDQSSLLLGDAVVTLEGRGSVQLPAGNLSVPGTATLINVDNQISNGGIGGVSLSMTNEAAGTITDTAIDLGGTLTNAGLLDNTSLGVNVAPTIDNTGTGNLLANGAEVSLYSGYINGGMLSATNGGGFAIGGGDGPAGVTIDGSGAPVTIAAGTTLTDFFDQISLPFTFEAAGGLSLLGTIDFAGTIIGADPEDLETGSADIPNAGLLIGAGAVQGFLMNTGTVEAAGGTMTVTGGVDGAGRIVIGAGAAFDLAGESAETIDFADFGDDRLVLATPTDFTGTFANMSYGDVITLGTDDIKSVAVVGGTTLAVTLTDNSTLDFGLANLHAGTSIKQQSTSDLVVACFAEGTRIRTADGERRVETLRAGDAVAQAVGGPREVIWVGHRHMDCAVHPAAAPVRVRAGAFGGRSPQRDLRLSPDHGVFVDGILIPVRHLVNDLTIVQEPVDRITYWHVELERHAVILAEDLPCESYLDTGNRDAFAGAGGLFSGQTQPRHQKMSKVTKPVPKIAASPYS